MQPPAATPVTTPVVLTVAIKVLLLLHVPPAVASVSVLVPPTVVDAIPEMGAGIGDTVTVRDAEHPPAR